MWTEGSRIDFYIYLLGTENIMDKKLPGMLLSLLIILKVFGSTESCSLSIFERAFIADCRNQGLTSVPQDLPSGVNNLWLQNNLIRTLDRYDFSQYDFSQTYSELRLDNNPWQCDCLMVPFRQEMGRSQFFESRVTCEGPVNFHGQKLSDISTEDLMSDCEQPAIVRFEHNNRAIEGETLHLVCEASGIPTPDITVILPSGLNVTVESVGRVTVDVNGTMVITNFTSAADAGLYVCTAASFVGSTSANLSVVVSPNIPSTVTMAPVTSALTSASNQPEISSTNQAPSESTSNFSFPTFVSSTSSKQPNSVDTSSLPVFGSTSSVQPKSTYTTSLAVVANTTTASPEQQSTDSFSLPVLIGSVCGAVVGSALLVAIILRIWYKKRSENSHSGSEKDEFDDVHVTTPSQRPHTDHVAEHREHLGSFEHVYEVIPASLPLRNMSGPQAHQTVSAAVHGADNPQVVMYEDGYESVKDDPQSHKNENSQVTAASKDAETVVQVMMDPDDYLAFVVTEKDQPQPNKYQNSQIIAAAKDALSVPSGISYENEDESLTGKDDAQSHKYENSQVIADAKDALAVPTGISYENDDESVTGKDDPQSHKYKNSQMISAAKDAVAVPHVISYENDDETADSQTQADNQNDPAAVHGTDTTNHYQQLRKEKLEQENTYTSLLTHDS
uniref:Ig-like domain-containing protein n=1 Tax=Branchiostoma floridae TaxID=7739 RepID=C3YAB4_BRAFL|eukprot:XP_002606652.1 hypothetical protein BRAFLDRAFT_91745 [Branchiostoma floridae]